MTTRTNYPGHIRAFGTYGPSPVDQSNWPLPSERQVRTTVSASKAVANPIPYRIKYERVGHVEKKKD